MSPWSPTLCILERSDWGSQYFRHCTPFYIHQMNQIWTLTMALLWWQHHKHCLGIIIIIIIIKLNMDKNEKLWAGTRYNMSMLNDSGPSLRLSNVTQCNLYVCLESISPRIWVWTNMFPVSARPAFIICVNSDASGVCLTMMRHQYLCTGYNEYWTLLHESSARPRSLTSDCHDWCTRSVHWLDITKRVNCKLGMLTHRCLLDKAPVYL